MLMLRASRYDEKIISICISLQDEYFAKYGGSVIPVQPNDVFFALHSLLFTIITISQCFIYDVRYFNYYIILYLFVIIYYIFFVVVVFHFMKTKVFCTSYISFAKLGVTLKGKLGQSKRKCVTFSLQKKSHFV